MMRRILMMIILLALLPLLLFSPSGGREAEAQEGEVSISASMNAYYYTPGEQAYLDVDMELPDEVRDATVRLDLLIYSSASTRSYLASFREEVSRSPSIRQSLEVIYPGEEYTDTLYELDLNRLGLSAGVYPIETRLTQGGETLASDFNYLVIINPEIGYPLNLALLWMLDFLPATDAQGNDLDAGLAAACSSDPSETGFLYALTEMLARFPDVHSSMVAPYTTYQDLEMLAETRGPERSETGEGEEDEIDYVKDGAAKVKQGLDEMFESGQVDLIPTSYALANLDLLISLGWQIEGKSDADGQIEMGMQMAEDMGADGRGFMSPLFHLSDSMLQLLYENEMEPSIVDQETVQYSEAGEALLQGTTLSRPINFINQNYLLSKAFMRDEALYDYLENTTLRDASHMVQTIFAELAVLQRERPYDVRSSVLAFPSNFVPSQAFLQELYGSLEGCTWLQTRYLTELNNDQFAIEGLALPAPVYPGSTSSYIQKLGSVRSDALDLASAIMPEDHPLKEELRNDILTAENYRFLDEQNVATAQKYLDSINATIEGETSQVNIEEKSTVTLSGTKGQLTVDITSTLDYPIEATLRLSNRSVSYPDGNSQQVIIEPRENSFDFSIDTRRKGSFIIDILLENGDLVIGQTSTTVNTSIINTLAIILLACLAALVALIVVLRRLSARLHTGKHAKGRKE
jgi:hypothetical protein